MKAALIGYTGFVGGNLLREHPFTGRYNSANIESIAGGQFDLVVCAGAPAAKWKANQDTGADRACLGRLMAALERVKTQRFVHISTVDVYGQPIGVDEDCPPAGATVYGRHRLELEQFVRDRFHALVVRLPALFGAGLKKNAIYDLLNNNQVEKIDSRSVFQFYNVQRLWRDIRIAAGARLSLIHLATEPVAMSEVACRAFGKEWVNHLAGIPPSYDMRTRHASLFGGSGGYICNKMRVLTELAEFVWAQKEGKQCA
ncbi:MAG TPA: NAD-dependent epimerase/dehydratase family protein [Gemmataceae bacterium]|nr:NAD-dependent epimerase/dehydratase family protein [Gemmataceae bacterium]